jgi:hypothetical protein
MQPLRLGDLSHLRRKEDGAGEGGLGWSRLSALEWAVGKRNVLVVASNNIPSFSR